MKNWIKKLTGIAALETEAEKALERRIAEEERIAELIKERAEAEKEANKATENEDLAKMAPKERATAQKQPWIDVIDVQYNKDNIKNGFFELDWNEYFILELKQNGYGADGDLEEEIVDRWFKDIVAQMLYQEGLDPHRGSGHINIVPLTKGKSEIS